MISPFKLVQERLAREKTVEDISLPCWFWQGRLFLWASLKLDTIFDKVLVINEGRPTGEIGP